MVWRQSSSVCGMIVSVIASSCFISYSIFPYCVGLLTGEHVAVNLRVCIVYFVYVYCLVLYNVC